MVNIRGSASGRPNILVLTQGTNKVLNGSEFTAANTKIIYGLDANGNFISYIPGQSDFLQGFTSLVTNQGYYAVALQDISVVGIVPTPTTTTTSSSTTTSSTSSSTTSSTTSAPFDPATVGATQRWNFTTGVTATAGKVLALANQIGTQVIEAKIVDGTTDASYQPTLASTGLNGKTYGVFDGVTNFLRTTSASPLVLNQPQLALIVARLPVNPSTNKPIFDDGATPNNALFYSNGGKLGIYAGGGAVETGNITENANGWHILSALYNGATSRIWVDGTQVYTGDGGSGGFNGLTIGSFANLNGFTNIEIADIIFSPIFAADDHNYLGNGLASFYGLTWTPVS